MADNMVIQYLVVCFDPIQLVYYTIDSDPPTFQPDPKPNGTQLSYNYFYVHLMILPLFWCTFMAIVAIVQYNGGFLPILCCWPYATTIGEPF